MFYTEYDLLLTKMFSICFIFTYIASNIISVAVIFVNIDGIFNILPVNVSQ